MSRRSHDAPGIGRAETFIAHAAPYASKPAIIGGGNVGSVKPPTATPRMSGATDLPVHGRTAQRAEVERGPPAVAGAKLGRLSRCRGKGPRRRLASDRSGTPTHRWRCQHRLTRGGSHCPRRLRNTTATIRLEHTTYRRHSSISTPSASIGATASSSRWRCTDHRSVHQGVRWIVSMSR